MKLATTTGDFSRYTSDQTEILKYLKDSGFEFADYDFGNDYRNHTGIYSSDFDGYVNKLNECCKKLDIELVQAHSPMGAPIAENNDDFVAATNRCIEACGVWGIKNIVVHSGYAKSMSKKETFERNKVFYEKLLTTAEKYRVNVLVENFNIMCVEDMYWIDNATDLLYLIEYVDHPLFHAVWDTGHANMQKMPQDEEIALLGSHIKALHVQDNNGLDDQHICPFFGTTDMASVAKGLKKIGYDGYFTFEACNFFDAKTSYDSGFDIPLEIKLDAERMLKKIGDRILEKYEL